MYLNKLETHDLSFDIILLDWDTKVLQNNVVQFQKFKVRNEYKALSELKEVMRKLKDDGVALTCCRLPHDSVRESIIIECVGFKFIEMVIHPFIDLFSIEEFSVDKSIKIEEAESSDLEELSLIAEVAFKDDRFTIDPRIPSRIAGERYRNWVLSCDDHPTQRAYKFSQKGKTLGFFIIEEDEQIKKAYWHLTAISPQYQGLGFGTRCWQAMLDFHRKRGMQEVSTTISTRNVSVLNLYSKLNFRFKAPQSTFHWVNPSLIKQYS